MEPEQDDIDSDYDIDKDDSGDDDNRDGGNDDDDDDDNSSDGAAGAAAAPALGKRARVARRGTTDGAGALASSGAAAVSDDDDDDEKEEDDDEDDDDDDDDDDEDADLGEAREPPADYLDDGTEEEEGEEDEEEEEGQGRGGGVRRPPSIQEFLAWRLLWRVPRGSESARTRYPLYQEATPAALTRGSLWQQIHQATGAALPSARNRAHPFYSPLDAGFDCSMFASRDAPYGLNVRQSVREAVTRDPRVAARVTLLGPPPPPAAASPTSTTTTTTKTRTAAAASSTPATTTTTTGAAAPTTSSPSAPSRSGLFGLFGPAPPPPPPQSTPPPQQHQQQRRTAHPHTPAGPDSSPSSSSSASLPPCGYLSGLPCPPCPRLLMRREVGGAGGRCGALSGAQMRHLACTSALPRYPRAVVDRLSSRAYIGQFSGDGQFFVAAFQDRRVRLYDVERGWRLRKDITTRMCRWTITDTCISPDQRFVIYSSIIPVVHLVEVGSVYDSVSSICNITQIHEPLNFDSGNGGFGIWSVKWSGDGREIVVGNNDASVVVMDVETKRVVASAAGHEDDVNAVAYADASPNIILSGSDDSTIKVWDRRTMSGPTQSSESSPSRRRPIPAGVLVGHTEGLTHLHSRADGQHVLSNAKDQTAKLWDLRMMAAGGSLRDAATASRLSGAHVPQFNWDYRWQEYPASGRVVTHPQDSSLQTFRGHTVQNTLIRAYFSPEHSTGQRFVYTGSADGAVHVYDVVSGQEVEGSPLRLHHKLVRDVSWHPYDPVLATVSWDGTVVRWDAVPPTHGSRALQVPGHDALNDDY
ncbi:hypothetical protein PLESTF_001547000 [Pleodorina starrii]|nr:hypothetical protein PLESTM_000747700 [Pleodorina starrii]GLC74709.1 hypothetical protein PLESTF_001547000 [Pleodorina starrii]